MTFKHNRRMIFLAAVLVTMLSVMGCGELNARSSSSGQGGGEAKFSLALASYTFRDFDLDQTLAMTNRVGIKHIAFKSFHLAMDSTPEEIDEAVKKVNDAGLDLYGGGVIKMKSKEEVDNAFEYAKRAGMTVIIGVPAPE